MTSKTATDSQISSLSLTSLVVVGVLSTAVLVSAPILGPAMATHVDGGPETIGYLSSADWFGSLVASLSAIFWASRVQWRGVIYLCLAGAVLGNFASAFASDFSTLFALRFCIGVLNGAILSVVFVALCHTLNADRSFGYYVFAQLALQAVLLGVFPSLVEAFGVSSLFVVLAAMPFGSVIFVRSLPRDFNSARRADVVLDSNSQGVARIWAIASLVGLAIYFVAPAMIWSYFDPLGGQFSLSSPEIGRALGMSAFAGMAGAAAALLIGGARRRAAGMIAGIGLSVVSVIGLYDGSGFVLFLLIACVFNFSWNFTFPFLMGVISVFDKGGVVAILSLAAQILGLALGPAAAGALVGGAQTFSVLLSVTLIIYVVSALIFLSANAVASRLTGSSQ